MYIIKLQFDKIKFTVTVNTKMFHKTTLWDIERHSNLQYELHIPLVGECTMDVEKEQYLLKKGFALLIPPGVYHSSCKVSEDYLHFVIPFQISAENNIINALASKVSPCCMITISEFDLSICNNIVSKIIDKDLFWRETLYAMYTMLFSSILKNLDLISIETVADYTNDDDRFSVIDNFFEKRLSENCTEEALSAEINLSKRQLNRVLKMNYGMGFCEKRLNSRMDRAQWLLRTTELSISEICELIGYNSETSFFKSFKKYNNMTPGEYRQFYFKKDKNDI